MFSWLRRKGRQRIGTRESVAAPNQAPVRATGEVSDTAGPVPIGENPANPGFSARGQMGLSNSGRSRQEKLDCPAALRQVLEKHGHAVRADGDVIVEQESGLALRALLAGFEPIQPVGIKTTTTIEIRHPVKIPEPIFEYQHSSGDSAQESISKGFEQWYALDFAPLTDAMRADPRNCLVMKLDFIQGEWAGMKRRVVLGPVGHFRQHAVQEKPREGSDEHPFCRCCLFTRCLDAFKAKVESRGFYALRLYAVRGPDGAADADCRINGEDFDPGKDALKRYVGTWPAAGVEFRKQYVIVQDAPDDGGGGESQPPEGGGESKEMELVGV